MRISDWSSDVCSSDLRKQTAEGLADLPRDYGDLPKPPPKLGPPLPGDVGPPVVGMERDLGITPPATPAFRPNAEDDAARAERLRLARQARSEEHTSELQSPMRSSYAVFCLNNTKI